MIDFVLYVILIDMVFLKVCVIFLSYFLPVWIRICIRIRSHMDNFGILALDPDSHENLCGSDSLLSMEI